MARVPKEFLVEYPSKFDVEREANNALSCYKSLQVVGELIVYSNGAGKNLISLRGTIPVKYQGVQYNIPINVHLPEVFPNQPPIIHVTPTIDMVVKPTNIVDSNGLVTPQYMTGWRSKSHKLPQCLHQVVSEFGKNPPVIAKPPQMQVPPPGAYGTNPPPYNPAGVPMGQAPPNEMYPQLNPPPPDYAQPPAEQENPIPEKK